MSLAVENILGIMDRDGEEELMLDLSSFSCTVNDEIQTFLTDKAMENRINEEKIELAKKAIARGKLSLEEIAETLSLPLAFVQELARPKAVMA